MFLYSFAAVFTQIFIDILIGLLISGKPNHQTAFLYVFFCFMNKNLLEGSPTTDCIMNCCLGKSHTNYIQIVLTQIEWKDVVQI